MVSIPTPCLQLQSSLQFAKKSLDLASIRSPSLLLVGFVLESTLFLLPLHLAFLLIPTFSSLPILSSYSHVLPSVLVLLVSIWVLLPASSYFLSTLLSIYFVSSFLLLPRMLAYRLNTLSLNNFFLPLLCQQPFSFLKLLLDYPLLLMSLDLMPC